MARQFRRLRLVTSLPSKSTWPLVGFTAPSSARPAVDLPQPDSPTSPTVSPGATAMLKSSSAYTVRRRLPTHRLKWTLTSRLSTSGVI